jgi:hypothetical protein
MVFDPNAAAILRGLQQQVQQLQARQADNERKLAEREGSSDRPYNIEDIPGKVVPYWALITIAVASSTTSDLPGTHTVSMDGPFCVTDLYAYWRPTGSASQQNRWRAPSSVEPESELAAATFEDDLIDFLWKLEDAGSDRARMSGPLPSALLSAGRVGTGALPVADVFPGGGIIRVTITPIRSLATNHEGTLYFVLGGYKKLVNQSWQV